MQMVRQTQTETQGGKTEVALRLVFFRRPQAEKQYGKGQQRVQGVNLGDDCLRPEMLGHPVGGGSRKRKQARRSRPPRRKKQRGARKRPQQSAEQVYPQRRSACGQVGEDMTQQGVKRVSGRVRHTGVNACHNEQAVILKGDGLRRGEKVNRKHGGGSCKRKRQLFPHSGGSGGFGGFFSLSF